MIVLPKKKNSQTIKKNSFMKDHYSDLLNDMDRKEWQRIEKPKERVVHNASFYKLSTAILAVIVVVGIFYVQFFYDKQPEQKQINDKKWYMVRLTDKQVFYGQIDSLTADPIVLSNVYYDYDQFKTGTSTQETESSNLRLAKRGKESYGPTGTMELIRSQVLFVEELSDSSKVLKAILDYQNIK